MKKIICCLFLIALSIKNTQAQNAVLDWAVNIGGTNFDTGMSTATDGTGNVYTTGQFMGTVDFDPGTGTSYLSSAGGTDIFVSKTDVDGNFLWAKRIGGTSYEYGRSVSIDALGNAYVTGYFEGTVDFNPGAGIFNLVSAGATDIFMLKLDPSGNFVWAKRIGGAISELSFAIAADASGNTYITGTFNGTIDFDPGAGTSNLTAVSQSDVFITKLDANGNFVWAKNIGGTASDIGYAICTDASGNVYTTGEYAYTVDFDPGAGIHNLTSVANNFDVFILKLDANGNFVWAKSMGGGINDTGRSIAVDGSGNVYTTGNFQETGDFDPGIGVSNLTAVGLTDIFVSKLDANGNFVWVKSMGGTLDDSGYSLALDNNGNVYTTGSYMSAVDFNPGAGIYNLTSSGSADIFISKLDSGGNFIWTKSMGGTLEDFGYSISVNSTGIYTTGSFYATVDFDPNAGTNNLTTVGSADIFLHKLVQVCSSTTSTIAESECSSYTVPSGHETYTVSGTYTDTIPNAAGCDSIITINLTISDGIAPVATNSTLPNITGQCSVASLTAPTATDNCAGTITGTHNATLPITAQGTTVVTWTYNDGNGNTSTQTQNVIISDNTAPVANAANLSNVTGQCSVISLTAPTATDNCSGAITGTTSTTFPITTPGTTVVTWTYTDGNGNSSTQTQNVIVTLPVATTTLNGITISATTSGATYQWINCGTGNTPIAGATSQSFTATANGTYAVIVTQNGCSATSACVTISTVGLEDLTKNLFTLYPNPNNGTFKIVTEVRSTITITNAAGQLVATKSLESGEQIIELKDVESGVYFVSATDSNGQSTVQRISIIK
ncbi:Beta-propeller repeat protein [compost metagenome]